MTKFNPGDKIRIIDCLKLRRWPGGENMIGKTGIIQSVHPNSRNITEYILVGNPEGINYTDEMLVEAFPNWKQRLLR